MPDILSLLERSGAKPYRGKLQLPSCAEWGGYTLVYYTREFAPLCAECATSDYFEWLYSLGTCEGWAYDPPVHVDVYWEGPDEICAGCNKPIPSAYGDPWADDDNGGDHA